MALLAIICLPFLLAGVTALAIPAPPWYRWAQVTLVSSLNLLVVALLAHAALL